MNPQEAEIGKNSNDYMPIQALPFGLPDEARNYVIGVLSGGCTLSLHLMEEARRGGVIVALAPADSSLAGLLDFVHGGLLPIRGPQRGAVRTPSLFPLLAEILHLSLIETSLCIVEDAQLSPGDFVSRKDRWPAAFFGEHVYYLLTFESATSEVLRVIKRANLIWHFLAALVEGAPDDLRHNASEMLSPPDFKGLAGQTRFFAVPAYDGEGFLLWLRDPSDPLAKQGWIETEDHWSMSS